MYVYMMQPEGYNDGTAQLCHLIKTIYGLKQSGHEWNYKLNKKLIDAGFQWLHSDPCIYIQKGKGKVIEIITAWVDDLLLFSDVKEWMDHLKAELGNLFEITNLSEPSKLVSIEITQHREQGTLTIAQTRYIESILERYGMQDANQVSTLLNKNIKLQSQAEDNTVANRSNRYVLLMGLLMYAAIGTHPNITYAVNKLCSFTSNPDPEHWTAAKRILRYLKGTKDLGITYTKGNLNKEFHGYTDTSLRNNYDMMATSGNMFLLHNRATT